MRRAIAKAGLALAAVALLIAAAPAAWAEELGAAKAAGQVGERPDGYLGVVDANAPPAIQQLVADVNAKRKLEYARIAQKNGITVDAVAALAGKKWIEKTPPGEYVMGVDMRWQKK